MRRLPMLIIGLLLAAAGSAIATGTTPPGLPWVTAQRQTKIKTNPASSAAADASLLLDSSSAGAGECMIGVDAATDVCLIDKEGDVRAKDVTASNEINGVVLSTLTTLDLYDPAPSANAISIQAPSGISSWLMTLPPNDGNSGDVLTTDGTGTTTWGTPGTGDITAIGSVTSGDAFLSTPTCDEQWIGCGASAGRIKYDSDPTPDVISVLDANWGIGLEGASIDEKLVVQAATTVVASLRASGGGAVRSILQLVDSAGANGWDFGYDIDLSSNNFTIRSLVSTTPATRFVIDEANGNVGIGTDSTPDTVLDVQGTFSCGTNGEMSVDVSGNVTAIDVAVNGGDITTTAATMNLIPSAATAINIGTTTSADINIGDSSSTVDFGDTASAATAFLPDADAGADLGSTSKHFNAIYANQEFTGPVRRCTADANCTVATTDRYVFMDEQNSARYVILPDANIIGQTISVLTGNTSGSVTVAVCTKQDANCGSTGTDVIESTNSASFGSPTATLRISIGNGRRYISTGSGVWIELQSP